MFSDWDHVNLSDHAQQHRELIQTYCQLSVKSDLSNDDTACLDSILTTAETNPLVSFLIDEADHMLAHLYGFVDEGDIVEQQRKLQTSLGDAWLNQACQDLAHRLKLSQCKDLQNYLKERGFYQGAIDGVMGRVTEAAMKECCEQQGELPQPLPIHTPDSVNSGSP